MFLIAVSQYQKLDIRVQTPITRGKSSTNSEPCIFWFFFYVMYIKSRVKQSSNTSWQPITLALEYIPLKVYRVQRLKINQIGYFSPVLISA